MDIAVFPNETLKDLNIKTADESQTGESYTGESHTGASKPGAASDPISKTATIESPDPAE
ncbi:hypothetical protein MMC07_004304 [Pseudocyphellaria aurata]|nr:hypothetical protein [Pseudocyphellaria aurata]